MTGSERILMMLENSRIAAAMDNRELLWRLMRTPFWNVLDIDSIEDAMLDEVARRLYPEFDSDLVQATETGWITPDGVVDYMG